MNRRGAERRRCRFDVQLTETLFGICRSRSADCRLGEGAPSLIGLASPLHGRKPPPPALTDRALMSPSPMIVRTVPALRRALEAVSYTHLRAHETGRNLV